MERKFALLTHDEKCLLNEVGLPIWESKMDKGIAFADPEFVGWARTAIEMVEGKNEPATLEKWPEILKALRSLSGIAFSEKLRESL